MTEKEFAKTVKRIVKLMMGSERILFHLHPRPDPDCLGSALALQAGLKNRRRRADVISGDDPTPAFLKFLPGANLIKSKSFSPAVLAGYDLFVALDSSAPGRITKKTSLRFPLAIPTVVIDHHRTNRGYGDVNLILPKMSSTAEIVYRFFRRAGWKIDKKIAECLFAGIYGDTSGFKNPLTTAETYRVGADLIEKGANFGKIIFNLTSLDNLSLRALGMSLERLEEYFAGRVVLAIAPVEEYRRLGLSPAKQEVVLDFLKFYLSGSESWIAVVIVLTDKGATKISLRSNHPDKRFDVSEIASNLGGGGHKGAAGAVLANTSPEEARKIVLEKLGRLFK